MKFKSLILFVISLTPTMGYGAALASDSAADSAYSTGWVNGSNGGYGWSSAWTLVSSGPGATFSSGVAFTLQANANSTAKATRSLGGELGVGQTFTIDYGSGALTSGASAGIRFENSAGNVLFEFTNIGGKIPYSMTDASGQRWNSYKAGVPIRLEFTLLSTSVYSLSVQGLSAPEVYYNTGPIISAVGGMGISQFTLFITNDSGSSFSQAFDNIAVIPEPSICVLFGLAAVLMCGLRKSS